MMLQKFINKKVELMPEKLQAVKDGEGKMSKSPCKIKEILVVRASSGAGKL